MTLQSRDGHNFKAAEKTRGMSSKFLQPHIPQPRVACVGGPSSASGPTPATSTKFLRANSIYFLSLFCSSSTTTTTRHSHRNVHSGQPPSVSPYFLDGLINRPTVECFIAVRRVLRLSNSTHGNRGQQALSQPWIETRHAGVAFV